MRRLLTLGLLGALGAASSSWAIDLGSVDKGAGALNQEWSAQFNQRNAANMAALYAEDAVLMPPSDVTLVSRSSIQEYWTKTLAVMSNYDVEIVEAQAEGNMLYAAGIWSATQALPNGSSLDVGGNVVRVMVKQPDGSWKLRLEAWN